jgi:predicted site-specific integrase-resolvase
MEKLLFQNEYMSTQQLADMWGVKKATVQQWRTLGTGPVYIKLGRRVIYRKTDIINYERRRTYQGTGEKIDLPPI